MANGIIVTAIEPVERHQRRVTLINTATGEGYEILYGDSVSERVIRMRAPLLALKKNIKRG